MAGDLGEHVPGFASQHQWFNVDVRGGPHNAASKAPCSGLSPYLRQLGHWVAVLGEIAARRNPCVHGHQKCVAGSCFSRSMAQCLQAAD